MKLVINVVLLVHTTLVVSENISLVGSSYETDSIYDNDSQSERRGLLDDFSPEEDIVTVYKDLVENYDKEPSKDLGRAKLIYDELFTQDAKDWIWELKSQGIEFQNSVTKIDGKELTEEEAVAAYDYTIEPRVNTFLRSIAKLQDDPKKMFQTLRETYEPRPFPKKVRDKFKNEDDKLAASMMLDLSLSCLLQNALKKLPAYEGTVYRMEFVWNDKDAFKKFYKKGAIVRMDAFTSTTITIKAMDELKQSYPNSEVTLEIKVSKSGADISKLSAIKKQEEVLIKAGSFFKVVEMKNLNEDEDKAPKYKIELEEVPKPK